MTCRRRFEICKTSSTRRTEAGLNKRDVAGELMEELRLMASWLELDRIEVTGRGDLGPSLQRHRTRRKPTAA
jgi:uncharacterized protein YcaQ